MKLSLMLEDDGSTKWYRGERWNHAKFNPDRPSHRFHKLAPTNMSVAQALIEAGDTGATSHASVVDALVKYT